MTDMNEPIILYLPWPPTINDYWKPVRSALYLGRKGRLYREAVAEAVREQMPGITLDERVMCEVTLYPPDSRVRDLDNYNKGLLDALTHSGMWLDDALIDQLFVYRGVVRKPGVVKVELNPAGPVIPFA